jgi:hypothetical protein
MGYYDRESEDTKRTLTTTDLLCSSIRFSDFLLLKGRGPCQVIRKSGPSKAGRYRYLGTDLFTKQLHEESSFTSTSGSEQAARGLNLMP